jgi:hypothetical protein
MIQIEAGMTSTEFLNAINSNSIELIGNYIPILYTMEGTDIEINLNSMFGQSDDYIGINGSTYINRFNQIYSNQDDSLNKPTSESVSWIDDFARISFNDESAGISQHEIWEEVDGGDYTLVTTLNAGVTSYDYKTDQNANLKFRIRAKQGDLFSVFADIVNTTSPLVLKTTQIPKSDLVIYAVNFIAGKSIIFNWGDGTNNTYTSAMSSVTKTYADEGVYYVQISGDVDEISQMEIYSQLSLAGTDITKWHLPRNQNLFTHLFSNNFVGSITDWRVNVKLGGLHLEGNNLESSCVDWLFTGEYTRFYDMHLLGHYINAANCGDLVTRVPKLAHMNVQVRGGISNWIYPKNEDYKSWGITLKGNPTGDISNLFFGNYEYTSGIELENLGLNGDLSGWFLGCNYESGSSSAKLTGNNFTKCPRGNYYKMSIYDMSSNICDSSEIDAILADIDSNVTTNTPAYDCAYTFTGVNMGIPSVAGLASKSSIEGKYTAAGKTATILINS